MGFTKLSHWSHYCRECKHFRKVTEVKADLTYSVEVAICLEKGVPVKYNQFVEVDARACREFQEK